MIPLNSLILFDTNILVYSIRGGALGTRIKQQCRLDQRTERPLISIVTVGEILSLAGQWNWGPEKVRATETLLHEIVIIGLNDFAIPRIYAALDDELRQNGKVLCQNDIWIAATAKAAGAHLLTSDKDFLPLSPEQIQVEWVDPVSDTEN